MIQAHSREGEAAAKGSQGLAEDSTGWFCSCARSPDRAELPAALMPPEEISELTSDEMLCPPSAASAATGMLYMLKVFGTCMPISRVKL